MATMHEFHEALQNFAHGDETADDLIVLREYLGPDILLRAFSKTAAARPARVTQDAPRAPSLELIARATATAIKTALRERDAQIERLEQRVLELEAKQATIADADALAR